MRKFIFKTLAALAVILTVSVPSYSATVPADTITAGAVFADLPLSTLDILSRRNRLDMLDYYDVDSIYKAKNNMEGFSELVKVTPRYLDVKITPVTRMQIVTLRDFKGKRNEPVAAVFYTIDSDNQAADTDVTFLDSDMKDLPRKKYLEYPEITEFFNTSDKQVLEMIEDLVPFPTIEIIPSENGVDITARLTVGAYMGEEDFSKIKPYMKPSLQFRWNGKKYERIR